MSDKNAAPSHEDLITAESTGFLTALKQAGKSDEEVKTFFDKYQEQRGVRREKYAAYREAIVGK